MNEPMVFKMYFWFFSNSIDYLEWKKVICFILFYDDLFEYWIAKNKIVSYQVLDINLHGY